MSINLDYLNELSGNDAEFVIDILSTFLEENPKDVEELRTAIQEKDIKEVGKLSHKMKSSLQMLGAEEVRSLALQIEQNIKKEAIDFAQAKTWATQLIAQVTALYPLVKAKIAELG